MSLYNCGHFVLRTENKIHMNKLFSHEINLLHWSVESTQNGGEDKMEVWRVKEEPPAYFLRETWRLLSVWDKKAAVNKYKIVHVFLCLWAQHAKWYLCF